MFHRLTVPTYFGGLPVGADYLNTPSDSSVGGSGVPATADGKKAGGPNDGTYFYAFGEDATSYFLNRGAKAVGENTDTLDDYLHRDVAIPVRTLSSTAGTPVSAIAITGQIFIGALGTVNNQENRDSLFSVLDSSGNEILAATGSGVVQVGLVHDGSGNNVVGTLASGFRNGVSLTLTNAIPVGTTYYVVYGERGNLAALPVDAFTSIKVRASQEVSAEVERLLRDLHGTEAYQFAWNDPWPVSINGLLRGGLDARYRNSSADAGTTGHVDTAGAGGTILRDGTALTMSCPNIFWPTVGVTGVSLPDPMLACFRLQRTSLPNRPMSRDYGGDVGLMQESPYAHTYDYPAERPFGEHLTGPLILDTLYHNFGAATVMGSHLLTKISTENVALVNPDAAGAGVSDCRQIVEVHATDFLRYLGNTALRATDLIEVINNATGAVVGTYRVAEIQSDRRLLLCPLTGLTDVGIGPYGVSTQVRLRWLQPTLSCGGHYGRFDAVQARATPHFMVAQPAAVLSDVDNEAHPAHSAMFLSALDNRAWGGQVVTNDYLLSAMAWGGFTSTGDISTRGILQGDGGIQCLGGRQQLPLVNRGTPWAVVVTATGPSVAITYPYGTHGNIEIYTNADVLTTIAFTPQEGLGYDFTLGDEFDLAVHIEANSTGPLSITWPASFHFSGADGTVPTANATANRYTVLYRFKYMSVNGTPGWYATRTDYDL